MTSNKKDTYAIAIKEIHGELLTELNRHGFSKVSRQNMYVRRLQNVYQILSFFKSQWDESLYLHIKIWLPEMISKDKCESLRFVDAQKEGMELGGRASLYSIGESKSWFYSSEELLTETILNLKSALGATVLPWFDTFSDYETVTGLIYDSTYDGDSEADDLVKKMSSEPACTQMFNIEDISGQVVISDGLKPASIQDVLSTSDDGLLNYLISLKFKYDPENGHRFVRQEGETFWVVIPEILSNGIHAGLHVYAWRHEVQDDEPSNTNNGLPDMMLNMTGGMLGECGMQSGKQTWLINTDDNLHLSVKKMINVLDKYAIEWFKSVCTSSGFIAAINSEFSEMNFEGSMYDRVVKKILNN